MLIEVIAIVVTLVFTELMMKGSIAGASVLLMVLDYPTLIVLCMLSFPILLRGGMWKDLVRGFKMLRKSYTCSLADLKRTQDVVELLQKQIVCAGVVLMSFSLIMVLGLLTEPAELGPNIAVVLIIGFYVAIFEMLLLPIHVEVKRRIIDYMEAE